MQLGDFLNQAGNNPPAPFEPVEFKVIHTTPSGDSHKVSVNAVMVCIPEKNRQKCLRDALSHVRKEYPDGIPPDRLGEEERYQILAEALRDADDTRKNFCSTTQLRACLVTSELAELWATYTSFLDREFPPVINEEEFAKLVEDAKKKSLRDLLGSIGSLKTLRALPALVFLFGTSQTPTSGDGEPA